MALIRRNGLNIKSEELKSSVELLERSGLVPYIKRSKEEKEFTIRCCHINPPHAPRYIAHACEVIADSVGLDPKEQVRYDPRKKLTIYSALKKAICDKFRD